MPQTLFMVIENFKNNDAVPVYRRFKERGRLAPDGLNYISSWVDHNLTRCYQVMEARDRAARCAYARAPQPVIDAPV